VLSLLAVSLVGLLASTGAAERATHKAAARGPASKIASAPPPASLQRAQRLGLGNMKSAGKLLQGRPDVAWVEAAGPEGWNGTLRFPVPSGYATRGFGSGKGAYHQAMDIAAPLGTKVRAAAGGLVAYAGNQVSGYGNMVILVHPGGFVTLYAHNQKNLVLAGQRVRRNAVIAELGSTGRSKGPHVHFELLYAGQNCDPAPLFRPAAQRKNGALFATIPSAWKQPHKKPKTLRCAARKHHPDYVRRSGRALDDEADDGDDTEGDEGSAL
jgi:murein DD-endopeptidase MepM/ murein hydrolase activator NlpD